MDGLFASIVGNLTNQEPTSEGLKFAAVSMMIRDRESPSVLLIKRADHEGDPWSGQIAFPGGKVQQGDCTAKDTAMRETLEEVGIDLRGSARFLGYGAVATTHTGNLDVIPSVFEMKSAVEVTPNAEVASYRWVSLAELLSPASRSSYRLEYQGRSVEMPAFTTGGYVVWGLTRRILSSVLEGR